MVQWNYFDKFDEINAKYLPDCGEGETMATQIVTAVNKLIYKWYNDGDVFDNTYHMTGWANDLSDYANWLAKHTDAIDILNQIKTCMFDEDYEELLKELADSLLEENLLASLNETDAVGSIYKCSGEYKFEENYEDEYGKDEDEEDW